MRHLDLRHWPYRIAFVLTATLLVVTLALLPMTVANVVETLVGGVPGRHFQLSSLPPGRLAPQHADLDVVVVAIDEVQLLATLRVSGYHVCQPACPWTDRVVLFSLLTGEGNLVEGLPPSGSISLPPSLNNVTQTIQLPLEGQPLRYPFDEYELQLGVVLEEVLPDQTVQDIPPAEAPSHLFLSVQERLAQHTMAPPVLLDPQQFHPPGASAPYVYLATLTFQRLLHLRVLTLLLVALVAAAAAYAVFLRPFEDLIINTGGLIIGIWGIRAILVPGNLQYITAVDLSLSVVILFLLGAITLRALIFWYRGSKFPAVRRSRR